MSVSINITAVIVLYVGFAAIWWLYEYEFRW
jgi:hypothetical protein